MPKENSTCRDLGHAWTATTSEGWFVCRRSHCGTYATCPACLGYRLPDTVMLFCAVHLSEVQFLGEYPLAEPVPVDVAPVLEQYTLW